MWAFNFGHFFKTNERNEADEMEQLSHAEPPNINPDAHNNVERTHQSLLEAKCHWQGHIDLKKMKTSCSLIITSWRILFVLM